MAQAIRRQRPAAVLIEGPDDATALVDWIAHPDTEPPLTLLSSWVDKSNKLGQNGVLTPSPDLPVRYRGWWPLVAHGPEYAALCAGVDVGAEVRFIDASLKAVLPTLRRAEAVTSDRDLAESDYVAALVQAAGHPTFEHLWEARFETPAFQSSTEAFRRAVLLFAWCARHVGEGEISPAIAAREAHMRAWVDRVRKDHPGGELMVVVGPTTRWSCLSSKGRRRRASLTRPIPP